VNSCVSRKCKDGLINKIIKKYDIIETIKLYKGELLAPTSVKLVYLMIPFAYKAITMVHTD